MLNKTNKMKTQTLKKQIITTYVDGMNSIQQLFELGFITNIEKFAQEQQVMKTKTRELEMLFAGCFETANRN